MCDPIPKSRFFICSIALMSLCILAPRPSVAECARESRGAALFPQVRQKAADGDELSSLNLLGIRYAKGQGVKRNPGLAMRFFLRSAIQGYTPAMANIGTLYEIGAMRHSDFRRAYAWVRAALRFGVPEEDQDQTVLKLWMIAAQLGPDRIAGAERLANVITTRLLESCQCSPGREPEQALTAFYEAASQL
jgi:TPR repeat protein